MGTKRCSCCNEGKDKSEFYTSKTTKDGYRCYCKACHYLKSNEKKPETRAYRKRYRQTAKYKQIKADYYLENKEQILADNKRWTKTKTGRLHSYKRNAIQRHVVWELADEEFFSFWGKPCSYCGATIETIGLDRIDCEKSYTMNNVVPCCKICNRMKLNLEKDEFITQVRKIVEFLK